MDSFPCQMQEYRTFKSDWSIQIKHVTSKIRIWFIYNSGNTDKCDIHYVDD